MTQYHYATMDALTFLQLARVLPSDNCPDAYVSDDAASRVAVMLARKGYRFVCIAEGLALFEKQLDHRAPADIHTAAAEPTNHLLPCNSETKSLKP